MKPQEPPADLDAEATRMWWSTLPNLVRLDTARLVTAEELADYCRAWSDFRRASEALRKHGYTYKTADGYPVARPEVAVADEATWRMLAFSDRCGLTPGARARLGLPVAPADDWRAAPRRRRRGAHDCTGRTTPTNP